MIRTKKDFGVAGLQTLLSVVTILFVIGLVVMIFVLMGGGLSDAVGDTPSTLVEKTVGHGYNTTSTDSTSTTSGLKITVGSSEVTLKSVTKFTGMTPLYARLRTTGGGVDIANATFTGDVATFSPEVTLSATTDYYLVVDSAGSFTQMYLTPFSSYPVVEDDFNWVGAWVGADSTAYIGWVKEITIETGTAGVTTQAGEVIGDTTTALAGVTTWFPIIIVITAMVVLILLTVLIITAIRGSGLVTPKTA